MYFVAQKVEKIADLHIPLKDVLCYFTPLITAHTHTLHTHTHIHPHTPHTPPHTHTHTHHTHPHTPHRHPEPSQRPGFTDIAVRLEQEPTALLKWSVKDKATHLSITRLGADLAIGHQLYQELQRVYK